jgi:Peptidase family M1 domain/Secretion system C-terminal sorting domain/Peptidase M1 N-terminal domain
MKLKLYLYLFTAAIFFHQVSVAQDPNGETYHRSTGKYFRSLASANSTASPNSPVSPNTSGYSGTGANIDVNYYRCDWTIDPSNTAKIISGTVTIYFKTIASNVSQVTFDLNSTVFNTPAAAAAPVARYHGNVITSTFSATDIFRVTLPSAIVTIGTQDSVSITYSGTPPSVSGQEEGYQRGELPLGSGNHYIYTLSESYEDRDWWPCKADMQDKADSMDIVVTVPNAYWVAANGKLVDSAINGANRTFKYKHRYPIATYLVGLGIAKYNVHHRGVVNIAGKNVPVVYYTYPNMTGSTLTTALSRMDVSRIELVELSNKWGPYPFADEKHGYYQHNWGGGIEHQTFSGMSGGSMASWSVIAHELGHQWFGNKVTFSSWSHLWLAEGFAKYSEVLAAELIPAIGVTPASHLSGIKTMARNTNTTPVMLSSGSIANSNTIWTTNNDNAIYQRGAMIVSMLRAMMGDARFFEGCRDYLNDPLLAYKSATSADLQRNLENNLNGVNLTPFFNAWVNGSGTPTYTGQYYIAGNTIQFTLTQSRNPVATPFMPMPVVIKIANAAGTKDTSVVIYHYSATQVGYAGESYGMWPAGNGFITYNLSFAPATITFDPDNKTMATGTLSSTGTPLDMDILSFTANRTAMGNQVNLSIANSEPIEKVILLKSRNGTDFIEAGEMNKTNLSGSANNYQFNDVLPFAPVSFYRARIHTTSRQEYSGIVKVQLYTSKDLLISPNPAKDVVNISFDNNNREKATVKVMNAEGKLVLESTTNNEFIHFDVSNLPAGVYMAQVFKEGQVTAANKLLVRH